MNRFGLCVLCSALALPLALSTQAAPTSTVAFAAAKTAEGTIKSVDSKNMSFVLTTGHGKEAKDITLKITADTKFTLDGKASTMDEALKAGNKAKVKHSDDTASEVAVTTPKKKS